MPDTPLPPRLAAAVLAAGEGRRLGGFCKALIRVDAQPLLARLWQVLAEAGVAQGVVVTGAHGPALRQALDVVGTPEGWRLVHNERHADGQHTSVRCALAALLAPEVPAWDLALLLPCDLPLLRAGDVREAVSAFRASTGPGALRPVFGGQPAHPVLINRAGAQAVLAGGPDADVRAHAAAHPSFMRHWAVDHDRGRFDLDTPDDLERLRQRTGWTVST